MSLFKTRSVGCFFVLFIMASGQFTLANSGSHSDDSHLDMYDALNLIDQEKYEYARDILLREEKRITDIGKLCSIYSSMLKIASATDNNLDGEKYADLFKKCYAEGSDPYVFLGARALYFKGDYEKSGQVIDNLLSKMRNELVDRNETDLLLFMDKNILSSAYVLKASILLIENEGAPGKVKDEVIHFAETAYDILPSSDTNYFLASVYQLYGDIKRSKLTIDKNDHRTNDSLAVEAILNSLKKNRANSEK